MYDYDVHVAFFFISKNHGQEFRPKGGVNIDIKWKCIELI